MNLKIATGISFGCIVVALSGIFSYQLYSKQQELEKKIRQLEHKQLEQPTEKTKIIETIVSKTQPWSQLQPKIQNGVAQVFSQIAEFDWLQPFKTPKQGQATGTAFFISDEGELLTNAHVVNQARHISIQIPALGQHRLDVDVIGVSMDRDIALIKLRPEGVELIKSLLGRVPFLSFGDSDLVHRADEVMALGYPLSQQGLKSTTGVVSGRERHMIQITAPINPGNSGGPTINVQGDVVGINTSVAINPSAHVSAQNVGYIVPINEVKLVLDDLRTNRLLRKPFLGLFFNCASSELTKHLGNPEPGGCYVVDVYKNSPLAKAGVCSEDMVYEINGHMVDVYGEVLVPWDDERLSLVDYVSRLKPGQIIDLTLYRHGKRIEVSFKFDHSDLPPIRIMFPGYEEIDYEALGGMVIMPLTMNHIQRLITSAPSLIKYDDLKNQLEPALLITHVFPGSLAQRSKALMPGMVVQDVNGKPVKTLQDFRDAVKFGKHDNHLKIKTTDKILVVLPIRQLIEEEPILAADFRYPVSGIVQELREAIVPKSVPSK
ncbi:MAG: trypsin-like peptidase domain-containing protein [Candidatus Babeliales bacterium]